jgi:hypothetical protein
MSKEPIDTTSIQGTMMSLIYLLLIMIVGFFGFLTMGDVIDRNMTKPQYSKEELLAMTEERRAIHNRERSEKWDLIEEGIHVKTGLAAGDHLDLVISNCTSCHSAKLITQNRASRAGWKQMIDWMQETQGLQNLGRSEGKILDYLAEHYAPIHIGRRQNLDVEAIQWYVLELEE